ncbi:MAG: multiheme c-type cytochrome, partial [Pirellulaceae bacterium]|nr:multiheme c-type cytochrome [Pirellulaceae bacterium]
MPRPDEKRERARNAILALIIVVTLVCGGVGIAFWAMKRSRNIATEDIRTKVGSLTKVKAPQGEYIGSKACEECHQEEYDLYQTHPKAQSFVAYRDAKRIESGEQQKAFDIGSYLFEANQYETEMTHHEKVKVGDKIAYELVRTMDYVLGSGKRERNYITNTGGILLQSPISWRTDEQKWWVCSDFDAESHLNFSRRIGDNCLFCHSGRPNPDGAGSDRFLKPAFHETAIGCERCHGPGKAHLDKQRANPTPGQPDDSIVNPANLSPAQRDHVCHQCHVRSTHVIPRYGANLFDFRPGGFIDDVVVTFVAEPESDLHWQLADQSRQMQSSKCFIASAGKLGCITCHGAHSVPAEEEKSAYYMAKCNSCHAEQGCALSENLRNKAPANGDCAKCHMPRLPQNNIPHIPIT